MIQIREVKNDDGEKIYSLLKECDRKNGISFDEWKRTFKWFREDHDIANDLSGLVLTEEDNLVGYTGFRVLPCKFTNEYKKALILEDTVIHPEHRGVNGIMLTQQLMKQFSEYPIMGLHFSGRLSQVWSRMNAKDFSGTNLTFTRPLTLWAFFKEMLRKKVFFLLAGVKGLSFLLKDGLLKLRMSKKVRSARLHVEHPFALNTQNLEKINNLCDRYSATYRAGIVRDYNYLMWRYDRHPKNDQYRYFSLWKNNKMAGLGILGPGNNHSVYVYELIYDPEVQAIEDLMIYTAFRLGKNMGGQVIYSKMINQSIIDNFKNIHFQKTAKSYNQALLCGGTNAPDAILFTYGDFKIA